MNLEQLNLILDLLQLSLPQKVKEKILENEPISTEYQDKVEAVLHLNLAVNDEVGDSVRFTEDQVSL